ncbi:MAG: hypothetical protein AAB583_02590 [Patescibacteria group bacterium]
MRQEQERSGLEHEQRNISPFRKLGSGEFIGVPPFSLPKDSGKEEGIRKTRFALRQEDRRDNREEQSSRRENGQKSDGFEPFLNQDQQEGNLFVNNYGGNYAHDMQLNRRRVERVLEIAQLDGRVFLTTLAPSRSRADAQDNELAAKRFLIFDRQTQKAEGENPYKRVVSIPEGWRIEINDQRITEERRERGLAGEKLKRASIRDINNVLKTGVFECVIREKLSSKKDIEFGHKAFGSIGVTLTAVLGCISFAGPNIPIAIGLYLTGQSVVFALVNRIGGLRKIDHPLEMFMPPVEIDKVLRTYAYLAGKERRLVREVTP